MDIRISGRIRALALTTCLVFDSAPPAAAATLVSFDFDAGGDSFTTTPGTLAGGLLGATLTDDAGRIGDLAGNPGRALSLSGFTNGNRLHLGLLAPSGFGFLLERLVFDARASASGPDSWEVRQGTTTLASGTVGTAFGAVDVPLAFTSGAATLVLDFVGLGATSATGTLRFDNLRLDGQLVPAPVPLPGALFLFATPLLGLGLRELRERYLCCVPAPAGQAHSRQPSTSGKYRPSMIGRGSSAAMMRA